MKPAAADDTAPKQQIGVPVKPGQSGNPAGRPKGAKSRFVEDFWRDLQEVWKEHGKKALLDTLRDDPSKFVTVAASKLPAEVEISNKQFVIVVPAMAESTEEWLAQTPMGMARKFG